MFALFKAVEKLLYDTRDFLWSYPDLLVLGEDSLFSVIKSIYYYGRPYSHIVGSIATIAVVLAASFTPTFSVSAAQTEFVEGAVMGVEPNGLIQTIDTVTPLIPSKFQLGNDLVNIIYEPLIEVNPDGEVEYKLAKEVRPAKDGKETLDGVQYIFSLRNDAFWHDGSKFTARDVVATFQKIVELSEAQVGVNLAGALRQMEVVDLDEYTVRMSVIQDPNGETTKLFPNFLELASFKIMPATYLEEINANTVITDEPAINRRPVGTGPFKFERGGTQEISLTKFESYHSSPANFERLKFRLFKTEDALINALKNGEIHSFASNSTKHVRDLEEFPKINQLISDINYQQYWGLYFNLQNGSEYLQDSDVRKALSMAIDYELMLDAIIDRGERTFGPIPKVSEYFNEEALWPQYDPGEAKRLLEDDGWFLNADGIYEKEGQLLEVRVSYSQQYDREQVISSIQKDWELLGVKVVVETVPLNQLKDVYLIPRQFEVLLYGMNTFVDPDRYELFHSTAIDYPGLNISGYKSSGTPTKKIVDKKVVDVPRSDRSLEIGRGTLDEKIRKQEYSDFQNYLVTDQPVIFLYHSTFSYYLSNTVQGVDLPEGGGISNRFANVNNWKFSR